ncbi:uncharacterized protein BDW47DRAFT_106604 [Aspergillus candidus]|uniref:Uncharacterized protein n=1 Tax=Aspergillus candidus TaxID=41067 RepID=A0A2I2FAM3_ASPCN|nr:hypothetical protein BDW47DRAFT_106604 [Aspergillus candidus]PLB37675.1 hypothetical protein BDW47DRAFT_106604 [Aspergillus candidus]
MCLQVVERFSVCDCLYFKHAIDPCALFGQIGHVVSQRDVKVGYACSQHSRGPQGYEYPSRYPAYPKGC